METIAILLVFLGNCMLFFLGIAFFRRKEREYLEKLAAFVTPREEGGLSDLGKLTDALSLQLAQRLVASIKGTLQGQASGAARAEKAVEGAIAVDTLTQGNDWLSLAMQVFPTLSKKVQKNPQLAGVAMSKLQEMASRGGKKNDNGNQPSSDQNIDAFKL